MINIGEGGSEEKQIVLHLTEVRFSTLADLDSSWNPFFTVMLITGMCSEWACWTSSRETQNSLLKAKGSSFLSVPVCSVSSATTPHKELAGRGMGTAGAENSRSQRGTFCPLLKSIPL